MKGYKPSPQFYGFNVKTPGSIANKNKSFQLIPEDSIYRIITVKDLRVIKDLVFKNEEDALASYHSGKTNRHEHKSLFKRDPDGNWIRLITNEEAKPNDTLIEADPPF